MKKPCTPCVQGFFMVGCQVAAPAATKRHSLTQPEPAMSTVTPHDLLRTLYTMAMMVEARDAYTGGHLWRVAQFSRLLAQACGLSAREVEQVALGGFLHGLGNLAARRRL
jgi:HD-GYP domain-containing protein (c-di-GMP phosphodiesterase class II)